MPIIAKITVRLNNMKTKKSALSGSTEEDFIANTVTKMTEA